MVEQIIRPTGLVDPEIEVRPVGSQVDDLLGEIRKRARGGRAGARHHAHEAHGGGPHRVLHRVGVRCRYLHSDIETLERSALLRDLRRGEFDVLIGINLLREGLDLPEVSLVAMLDADKEGFLRSAVSLIQTIGRAARNVNGRVILYADHVTDSMKKAHRARPTAAASSSGPTTPSTASRRRRVKRNITDLHMAVVEADYLTVPLAADEGAEYRPEQLPQIVAALEVEMKEAAAALDFEKAAGLRDRLLALKELELGLPPKAGRVGMKGLLGAGALAGADALGKLRGARRPQQRRRRR